MTFFDAFFYYAYLIYYTLVYNILAEVFKCIEVFLALESGTNSEDVREVGFYRKIKYCYANGYLFLMRIFGVKIYVNTNIKRDRMLWISNHRSKVDGLIIQAILLTKGIDVVAVVKKSISYLPIFGPLSKHIGLIFIGREKSSVVTQKLLESRAKAAQNTGTSILIFPEGTTMNPTNKIRSDNYAKVHDLSPTENVLLPKNTGFTLVKYHGNYDMIGNVTIRYADPELPNHQAHTLLSLFKVFPKKIYLDIKCEDFEAHQLYEKFREKDQELSRPIDPDKYQSFNGISCFLVFMDIIIMSIFSWMLWAIPWFPTFSLLIILYSWIVSLCKD